MINRYILLASLSLYSLCSMQAQEINAKLVLSTQKIQVADREKFVSLERNINALLNEQKWTDASFNRTEKIDCSVIITINEVIGESTFKADIQLTARRPVYNASYISTLLNYRDTQLEFDYIDGQALNYNNNNLSSNLVATIAYYVYIILGLDFDSFSLHGGPPYFEQAMEIANQAQSLNTKGWEPFAGKGNRYELAVALTEESSKTFHSMWYNYHRMGLDEMAANASRGRIRIIDTLTDLQKLAEARPSSALLTLYAEAKLEELIKICSLATEEEKTNVKKTLLRLFPSKKEIINSLQ